MVYRNNDAEKDSTFSDWKVVVIHCMKIQENVLFISNDINDLEDLEIKLLSIVQQIVAGSVPHQILEKGLCPEA